MKNEFWLLFQILISTRLCWLCPSPECLFVYVMWHVKMLFNDLWKWVELQSSIKRWVIFQQTCFLSIIGSHTFHIPLQELHTRHAWKIHHVLRFFATSYQILNVTPRMHPYPKNSKILLRIRINKMFCISCHFYFEFGFRGYFV